jgi:aminoglycoside phosphotransferase (APT) family kinase protein
MRRDQSDVALAARLVAEQFPQWAELPVVPVEFSGSDNLTFRLGDTMSVRLPSGAVYAGSIEKEARWLPHLAPHLPYPIPVPVASGAPSATFPWPWSIRRWLDGRPAATAHVIDPVAIARQLAGFLRALGRIDPVGGPSPGEENFRRGGDLTVYDDETRRAMAAFASVIDVDAATEMWEAALAARWDGPSVWFHGDVAPGNLLLDDSGRLAAVIDFGQFGIGDPACDLAIAWTLLSGSARDTFRAAMAVDDAMWTRGRGWALWKALSTVLAGDAGPYFIAQAHDVLRELLTDRR